MCILWAWRCPRSSVWMTTSVEPPHVRQILVAGEVPGTRSEGRAQTVGKLQASVGRENTTWSKTPKANGAMLGPPPPADRRTEEVRGDSPGVDHADAQGNIVFDRTEMTMTATTSMRRARVVGTVMSGSRTWLSTTPTNRSHSRPSPDSVARRSTRERTRSLVSLASRPTDWMVEEWCEPSGGVDISAGG